MSLGPGTSKASLGLLSALVCALGIGGLAGCTDGGVDNGGDAGPRLDIGQGVDAGPSVDAASISDALGGVDAGPSVDAASISDALGGVDAGPSVDAASISDALGGVDAGSTSGCEVLVLLERCTGCHGAPPSRGAPMSLTSLASLRAPSRLDPAMTYAQRSLSRILDPNAPMPPVGEPSATAAEADALGLWITSGMPDCGPDGDPDAGVPLPEPSPNLIPQDELFVCNGEVSQAPTRLRRLNRWQWTRNVGGAVTRSWTGFSFFDNPFDPSADEPYSTYATDETLDEANIELFLPVVAVAGPPWAGPYTGINRLERLRSDRSLRCMICDASPTPECVRHYLSEFLEHGVLFRPARPDELDRLQAFSTTVLAAELIPPDCGQNSDGETPRTHSITRISTAAWLTTGAMFREELGTPDVLGRADLTDWELAQQLAYIIESRAPGATPKYVWPNYSAPGDGHLADVADAARDGSIRDPQRVAELYRLHAGGTDATRFDLVGDYGLNERERRGEHFLADGGANFFREWLGYTKVPEIFKDRPEATSQFDDGRETRFREQQSSYNNLIGGYYGHESTLVQQMDDVVARVVVADVDVLRNLLTTRDFFLPSTAEPASYGNSILYTGQAYGTVQPIEDAPGARWVTLPENERAGVLTHPAWLGSHGGNFEDDPSLIHRGHWVRESLLCDFIPPLSSVRVMAQVGPRAANKSARARVDDATADNPECQGCHRLMNPLGYPFEMFNQAGYLREWDHAADGGEGPPDGSSTLVDMPDPTLNGPVRDAVELSEKLAVSNHAKRCFVRQAFRYYMGRNEDRSDACTLTRMEEVYDSSGGSFFSMVIELTATETWSTRRLPAGGE